MSDPEPADLLQRVVTMEAGQPVQYLDPADPAAREKIAEFRHDLDAQLRASEAAHAAAAAGLQDLSAG